MLKSFSIRNFKCFRDFTIPNLDQINLITGLNNVGKTALLEALFLHAGRFNPTLTANVNFFRGLSLALPKPDVVWGWHFTDHTQTTTIGLQACTNEGMESSLSISLQPLQNPKDIPNGPITEPGPPADASLTSRPARHALLYTYTEPDGHTETNSLILTDQGVFLPEHAFPQRITAAFLPARAAFHIEDASILDQLTLAKRQPDILELVRFFDSRIKGFSLSAQWGPLIIVADLEGQDQLMPLPFVGEGLVRFVSILLHVVQVSPAGLLLIDEIDNGIHYSILPKVWKAIAQIALQRRVQIVATTHSHECVRAAHEAFTGLLGYPFRLHRLERTHNTIDVISYDQQTLTTALDADFEVR